MPTKHDSPCLLKAHDEEPIFVLRSQDYSSPTMVAEWIKQNIETCPADKLRAALNTALAMRDWSNRKTAD